VAPADPRQQIALALGRARPGVRPQGRQVVQLRPLRRPGALTLGQLQQRALEADRRRAAGNVLEGTSRSLFEQVSDVFTGLPKGLAHLGASAVKTAALPVHLGIDLASGELSADELATLTSTVPWSWDNNPQAEQLAREYVPLAREVAGSVGTTSTNLRHPSRYIDAINEGRIVDTLLEDVGNVSLLGAPLAKGLGAGARGAAAAGRPGLAAGLERASSAAYRAGRLGGEISDAPLTILQRAGDPRSFARRGLRAVGRAADSGFQRALTSEGRMGEAARTFQTRQGLHVTPEGRIARAATRKGHRLGQRAYAGIQRDMHDASRAGGFNTPEEGAALAMLNKVGDVDELIQRHAGDMTPDEVRQLHVLENKPEQTFTADVQQIVRQYLDGSLDPEARARVDAHMDEARPVLERLEQSALSGEGRAVAMDPEQLGDAPIDRYVVAALQDMGFDKDLLTAIDELRAEGYEWADLESIVPELADVLSDPQVYPSAWRPAMMAARRANSALDAEGRPLGLNVPARPDGLLAAGIERPRYLPGGRSNLVDPKSYKLGQEPVNMGMRGLQGLGADKMRVASEVQPYSLRALADKAGSTMRTVEFNKALLEFAQNDKLLSARTLLGDDVMDGINAMATRAAEAQANVPERYNLAFREAYGDAVIQALADKGYEIFAGDPTNPQVGDFNPDQAIAKANVTSNALVLPIGVKARLVQHMAGKNLNPPLQALRYINQKFKGAVLPFSLRWHLGDLVGGAFMGWVGGGIPPWELVASMRDLKDLSPAAREAILRNPEFVDAGLSFEESRWRNDGPDAKQPRTPIGRIQRKSFNANAAINRVNRQGYLLAKVQRLLEQKGLDLEAVDSMDGWDAPDVQEAVNAAVADANKVMGTFDELTPFEQRWMKNIFPFYVWSRHITMLAARTAVDNPARLVWTLRLGSYGADDSELPEWLRGSLRLPDGLVPDIFGEGDQLLPLSFLNPFNDVVNTPAWTPQGVTRSLSPGVKLPLAGVFGVEPGRTFNEPFRQITRPYGEERNPLRDTLAAGLRTFPITREAINLAPTGSFGGLGFGPHPRYNSGRNMVDRNGNPIDESPRALSPLRLLGIPVPTSTDDAEAIQKAADGRASLLGRQRKKVRLG
jgi:hypothetical protein